MKRIVLLIALFALGLSAASFALAGPPPGKGKDKDRNKNKGTTTSATADPATCRPQISVILKGEFAGGGGSSFTMDVKQANSHGREFVGKSLTLKVDATTQFRRQGHAELADFKAGDRLNVQARACKAKKGAAKAQTTAPSLLAKRVDGHPAKASDSESDEGEAKTP